jgi:hypothetical protein
LEGKVLSQKPELLNKKSGVERFWTPAFVFCEDFERINESSLEALIFEL